MRYVELGGTVFKKIIVSVGLILLVAGVVISVFPRQESYVVSEAVTLKEWPLQQQTLTPQNTTFYGQKIEPTMWFKLNISCSDSVRTTVSLVRHTNGDTKDSIFNQTGANFNQTVSVLIGGTYYVDIINENPFSVTLNGNVLVQAQHTETKYRNVYPYTVPGLLVMLGGAITSFFGIFRRTRRPSRKSKGMSSRTKRID
jgi:hypothetical protein